MRFRWRSHVSLVPVWIGPFVAACLWLAPVPASEGERESEHQQKPGRVLRLNQIQVIGSHNSYHIAPDPAVLKLIETSRPGAGKALSYTHRPLAEQFGKLGIRQVELDLFADPEGGLYANPRFAKLGKSAGQGQDYDPEGILKKPGLKILHVPDVDFRTTALTFVDALKQVRAWSQAHPRHVPIFILVELKDESHPTLTKPVAFGKPELDALDAEILSVFDRKEILTPDDVRGEHATLPEALRKGGWPALDATRGKVIFALDNEDKVRDLYIDGHLASKGRLLFVSVQESDPSAAWMKINDPVGDFDRIQRLVSQGFLVRTRADADTVEARKNDVARRDKALASGAQFVSTDFREAVPEFSDYQVQLPGGVVARVNPVSARGDKAHEGIDLEVTVTSRTKGR